MKCGKILISYRFFMNCDIARIHASDIKQKISRLLDYRTNVGHNSWEFPFDAEIID